MLATITDQIGEWNPQLLREIKGRLKPRNIAIVSGMSVVSQLLLCLYYEVQIPIRETDHRYTYCEYKTFLGENECLQDSLGNLLINRELWWLDIFIAMSLIATFLLLVVGTYMVVNDLAKEERRDTLGFIRLSPQPAQTILTGKILGVPILLYLFTILALPLHVGAGLAAHIPLTLIFGFYGTLIASCFVFYSAALLYGLTSKALVGFQPWLGSGAVFFFLFVTTGLTMPNNTMTHSPADWLALFHPGSILPYLVDSTDLLNREVRYYSLDYWSDLKWFGLPLWQYAWSGVVCTLLNYGVVNYWIWQGLKRRFHNQDGTVLSKVSSYWFTGTIALTLLGFTTQERGWGNYEQGMYENFAILFCFNLILFLGLIAALSPHRQTLHDWARYRHQTIVGNRKNLWQDLLTGEKSPATIAIAVNLLIATLIFLPGTLLTNLGEYRTSILLSLVFNFSVIFIYAIVAQLMLLMPWNKRAVFSAAVVSTLIILPLVIFGITELAHYDAPGLWLFSAVPVAALEYASVSNILLGILGQWLVIAAGCGVISKQLQQAGESETKALLSGR